MWRKAGVVIAAGVLVLPGLAVSVAPPDPAVAAASSGETRIIEKEGKTLFLHRSGGTRFVRPGRDVAPRTGSAATAAGVGADFDGDGIGDVVSTHASRQEDDEGVEWTGSGVVILYSAVTSDSYDRIAYGAYRKPIMSLAAGDFDGDGYDDLSMGYPFTGSDFGETWVFYGSSHGLGWSEGDIVYLSQGFDLPGDLEPGDEFGRSVAAGDINGDGYADLAVGSPGEAVGTTSRAGTVHVLWGSASGLIATETGAIVLSQADAQVPGESEAGDEFGMSVDIGDVTGDGYADLAVGSPGENGYGMVSLLLGSPSGINPNGATAQVGTTTSTVTPRRLGQTVLVTDLTGDGLSDVVSGAPDSTVTGHTTAGAVSVHPGTASGLTTAGQGYWHQDSAGVPGAAENGDRFGTALVAGPVVGSSRVDLVVGAQNEAVGSASRAGAIVVLPGAATTTGLTGTGSLFIDQNTVDVPGTAEAGDQMGSSLQVIGENGYAWLVVGAMEEQLVPSDGPGSGMLTWFVNDSGSLRPFADAVTGPELSRDRWAVFHLGMAGVPD